MKNYKGMLIVVSGPSGSGKGSICFELSKQRADIKISVSATSRSPRDEDIEGKSYYFKTEEEFQEMINNNELLEWVVYCDNYYGTPIKELENRMYHGINVILEIEVMGALKVKEKYPDSVLIFVVPPEYKDLIDRLRVRGTEDEEVIRKRINKAIIEIQSVKDYDYLIVNDTVENAVQQINAIIDAEKNRVIRNQDKLTRFINTLKGANQYDRTINQ